MYKFLFNKNINKLFKNNKLLLQDVIFNLDVL